MNWIWPIKDRAPLLPDYPGTFGAVRKYDKHSGVDLYCEIGDEIVAVEDGEVIEVCNFTGKKTGSPWWNDTKAVLVQGTSGIILYGEVAPSVKVGEKVKAGQKIATIKNSVLTSFKGRPMVMLHMELIEPHPWPSSFLPIGPKTYLLQEWSLNQDEPPQHLLDPTQHLIKSSGKELKYFDLNEYDGISYTLHVPTTDLHFEALIYLDKKSFGLSPEQGLALKEKRIAYESYRPFGPKTFACSDILYMRARDYSTLKLKLDEALEILGNIVERHIIRNLLIDSAYSVDLGQEFGGR